MTRLGRGAARALLPVLACVGACGGGGGNAGNVGSLEPAGAHDGGAREAASLADASVSADANADVDVENDPRNCGWIGHDCRGARCSVGACESQLVSPACRPGDVATATALRPCGRNSGMGMALQGAELYWLLGTESIGSGALYHAKSSGAPQPALVPGEVSGGRGLANDGQDLVLASLNGGLLVRLRPGGASGGIHMTPAPAWPRAADGALFWLSNFQQVRRLDPTAVDDVLVYEDPSQPPVNYPINDFAVAAGYVYMASCADPTACSILKVPAAGGAATVLATNQRYVACLDVTPSHVVWSLAPTPGAAGLELRSVPLAGGTTTTLAAFPNGGTIPSQVLVDGASVFSIVQQGIVRVAVGGGSPRAFAPSHRPEPRACHQMTTDAEFLYFVTATGEVRRVAK